MLETGQRAVGFGVGDEPVPAVLRCHGRFVTAADRAADAADGETRRRGRWQATGQRAQTGQLLSVI